MFVYKEVTSNDTMISSFSMGTVLIQLENVEEGVKSSIIVISNITFQNVSYVFVEAV